MFVRRLFLAVLVAPLFGAVMASAASLGGATSRPLGGGDTSVARCDTSVNAELVVSGTTITAVSITGIAVPACVGGRLSVVVTANGTEITTGGPIAVTGSSASVPVTTAVGLGATDVRAVIVGP